ncbi:hypothetical protein Y032_0698g1620 [Ancylostoma ceylanicum]|uniref:Uncharacterized protein n=1 Tax=Ancylostoma ceylanicum TaxID=53326 RepID=A0A016WIA9_9BILA|nr:hypothetical protein Y032_0698g1620 [Ancylostoma ceylanicum]
MMFQEFSGKVPYLLIAVGKSMLSSLGVDNFFDGLSGSSAESTLRRLAEKELMREDGDVEHFHDGTGRSLKRKERE